MLYTMVTIGKRRLEMQSNCRTGLYNPSNAETLSAAFNLGVIGVASLPEKSKTMLNALDLATTTTNIRSKLSNIKIFSYIPHKKFFNI